MKTSKVEHSYLRGKTHLNGELLCPESPLQTRNRALKNRLKGFLNFHGMRCGVGLKQQQQQQAQPNPSGEETPLRSPEEARSTKDARRCIAMHDVNGNSRRSAAAFVG